MSRFHSYINSAAQIIDQYAGKEPLASFLQSYFRSNKKYGSRDRKTISNLCYSFFRLGKQSENIPVEEKLLLGLFLTSDGPDELLEALRNEWNQLLKEATGIDSRIKYIKSGLPSFNESALFPWKEELSEAIEIDEFRQSHLRQPDLFLRVRPGNWENVMEKLQTNRSDTWFEIVNKQCIALPNSTKLDGVIELNKEAVIQDYSSQRIGEFLEIIKEKVHEPISVWDACAGSGGKSILAKDILGDVDLTVSDIRESILINLKKRFNEAGIEIYKSLVVDLASDKSNPRSGPGADLIPAKAGTKIIIVDAPCTGSGTWGRIPEQLFFFNEKKIEEYASKQKKILNNTVTALEKGGYLLYCTCSVFRRENEENVEWLLKSHPLQLIKMELLKGYDKKADTLFAALFTLNN